MLRDQLALTRVSDRRNPSLSERFRLYTLHTRTHTYMETFRRFTRMPVYPILEPTHGSALGHDQQCAMRAARFIMGFWKGLFAWRQFQGVHPACLRMLEGRSRVARPGRG